LTFYKIIDKIKKQLPTLEVDGENEAKTEEKTEVKAQEKTEAQ